VGEVPVVAGLGDEMAAGLAGRGRMRASNADREQAIDTLKAAFVQGRLAKDEFDLRVGQAFAARTRVELAAVTAKLPAEPTTAKPPTPARAQSQPPVLRPGSVITVATTVCAGVWMFGFLVPWPRGSEGDPPHGVVLLVYLTTFIYLFVLAMTLWLGGAVMVESWLKRRSDGGRARRASLWQTRAVLQLTRWATALRFGRELRPGGEASVMPGTGDERTAAAVSRSPAGVSYGS
jgi:Domain of unknown function (DUF1707)